MEHRFLTDFQDEFDHSSGRSRYGLNSAISFYSKWKRFMTLATDVSLDFVNADNALELYCISKVCAIKCKRIV